MTAKYGTKYMDVNGDLRDGLIERRFESIQIKDKLTGDIALTYVFADEDEAKKAVDFFPKYNIE